MSWQQKFVDLKKGNHPNLVAQINGHYLVFGESQFLPGYMILIYKNPEFKRLSDLKFNEQIEFMLLVTCIQATLSGYLEDKHSDFKRCNVEILGNKDHYIHAHIWPRFGWEIHHLAQDSVRSYTQAQIKVTEKKLEEANRQINKAEFSFEFLSKLKESYEEFAKNLDVNNIPLPATIRSSRSFE